MKEVEIFHRKIYMHTVKVWNSTIPYNIQKPLDVKTSVLHLVTELYNDAVNPKWFVQRLWKLHKRSFIYYCYYYFIIIMN